MTENAEGQNELLQNNVKQLAALRNQSTAQAAETAIKLAAQTANMLFSREQTGSEDPLAQEAGKARYDAGGNVKIWGTEGEWNVVVVGSEKDRNNPDLV